MSGLSEEKIAAAIENVNMMIGSKECDIPDEELQKVAQAHDLGLLSDGIKEGRIKVSKKAMDIITSIFGLDIMYIEEICQHYGISRATHARWMECGKMPRLRKDSGGKKYNYLHECEETLRRWNEVHK